MVIIVIIFSLNCNNYRSEHLFPARGIKACCVQMQDVLERDLNSVTTCSRHGLQRVSKSSRSIKSWSLPCSMNEERKEER